MTNKAKDYDYLQAKVEEFLSDGNKNVSMQIIFDSPHSADCFRMRLNRHFENWSGCYHYIKRGNTIHIEKEGVYFD